MIRMHPKDKIALVFLSLSLLQFIHWYLLWKK